MKRPLALFAVTFFAVQLLALNLPQQVLLPIAAVLVCVLTYCMFNKKAVVSVVICAAAISLIWNFVFVSVIVKSNFKYINKTHNVSALVKSTKQYSTSYMSADLQIYQINNEKVHKFNVKVENLPHSQVGEYINLNLQFQPLPATRRLYSYTDGVFLAGEYINGFKSQHRYSIFYYANNVQQFLSNKIQLLMPNENGYVASAMAFGDKSKLTWDMKNNFKSAGLSHLLVVSGMHLAAASGMAFLIFNFLLKKRKISAIASIVFIIAFAFVTGITSSALRAGIMLSIAMLGMCFYREADSFTSIAFAGLLMCVYNPFFCYDIGFLLSYAATLGVLLSNEFINKLNKTKLIKNKKLFFILKLAVLPLSATLATMPILIVFNLGISVLGVLFNVIITPFLGVITALTFISVIFSLFMLLSPLAYAVSFINSVIISVMLFLIRMADKIPWSLMYVSGAGAALIVIALYVLIYLQIKIKPQYGIAVISAFIVAAIAFFNIANLNLVKISPISTNLNASVLLWTSNKGVLISREKTVDVTQINAFLKQNNIYSLDLVINLHKEGSGINELNAQKTVNAYEDFKFACSYEPFTDIIITIQKQEKGASAFISINGFTVALNSGEYNFDTSEYLDVYISGISRGVNFLAENIVSPGNAPNWLLDKDIKQNAKIVVNKRHLYMINEGFYGFD